MIVCFGEVLVDCLPDEEVIGGAPFNVAIHLKRLGNEVDFVSSVSEDEKGNRIASLLKKEELTSFVDFNSEHPTGYVSVWFEGNEPKYTIHEPCSWQYLKKGNHANTPELFVFGSLGIYFPQNTEVIKQYRQEYSDTEFLCDLNLRAPMFSVDHVKLCLELTDILKVNEDELDFLRDEVFKVDSYDEVIKRLASEYDIAKVLVTKAEKGVEVFWDGESFSKPAPLVPPEIFQDAIGAGDSFTAVFIHKMLKHSENMGDHIQSNTELALAFASKICANKGAIPEGLDLYEQVKN